MGILCNITGHKLKDSIELNKGVNGFYELEFIKVCLRCGEVNPETPRIYKYISTLL
ncbi:hypothetical protein KEJ50_01940 [Candidatus Bathyarchaeota archaeon]|nr:hypothetical protein [Candidatus Bathyarchaeota archaeon]